MSSDEPPLPASQASRSRRVHRELLKLIALVIAASATFLVARMVAAHRSITNERDAAAWFTRAQESAAHGDVPAAVNAYGHALAKDKDNRDYSLALARALARNGGADVAERSLLQLRESAPEDSDVNLELARIAAGRGDVTTAVRYYRNALYAPAAAADATMRRGVRLELIRFLLSRDDRERALPELLAAANDAPDDSSSAVTLGGLFASAGDYRRAGDQFVRALKADPHNAAAIAGAGTAAFNRGDYPEALKYLSGVPDDDPDVAMMREIAEHVLRDDPLAARIGASERRRRLMAALTTVKNRLDQCAAQGPGGAAVQAASAETDVDAFAATLPQRGGIDTDTLDEALAVLFKAEQTPACGEGSAADRALPLIARLHGADGA